MHKIKLFCCCWLVNMYKCPVVHLSLCLKTFLLLFLGISLHVDSLTDHSVESDGEKVPCRIDGFACKPGTDLKDKRSEIDLTSPHGSHGSLSPKPMISSPLSVVEAPVSDPIRDKTKVCTDTQSQNTKPKLWSLAEIATSDNKQNQNCSPTGTIWNSSQSGASPSAAILARPIYYTSPFYGNYGSYGNFGQGILRYGSIHKHSPESMLKANHANQVQMEQHFIRASHAESKKGKIGIKLFMFSCFVFLGYCILFLVNKLALLLWIILLSCHQISTFFFSIKTIYKLRPISVQSKFIIINKNVIYRSLLWYKK